MVLSQKQPKYRIVAYVGGEMLRFGLAIKKQSKKSDCSTLKYKIKL